MTGFSNPIAGDGGALAYPRLQSPNFVHGVSGWQIARSGAAEFNSITLPPGTSITVTFAATAPASPHAGDLWYDTSNGDKVSQWSGAAWTAYQLGTGAIAAGAITASLIAANTITAAQIAAGTITAAQIAAGTITGTQIAATTITGSTIRTAASAPNIVFDAANNRINFNAATGGVLPGTIQTGATNGEIELFADTLAIIPANNLAAVVVVNGGINAQLPGGAVDAPETWHAMTLLNSWSNQGGAGEPAAQYRLLAETGMVAVVGDITHAATTGSQIATLPAAYRPATNSAYIRPIIIAATNVFASSTVEPILKLDSTGALTLINLPAGTTRVFFSGIFPLNT